MRIIQSIPSPKAEPFKRWLAQVGYERVKEIENPELASARARELYRAKGYCEQIQLPGSASYTGFAWQTGISSARSERQTKAPNAGETACKRHPQSGRLKAD